MAAAKDFLQDENEDEVITAGDYAVGESDQFHINDIILSVPGTWRENPQVGVALESYQSSAGQQQKLNRNILQQLEADGYVDVLTEYITEGNKFGVKVVADRP